MKQSTLKKRLALTLSLSLLLATTACSQNDVSTTTDTIPTVIPETTPPTTTPVEETVALSNTFSFTGKTIIGEDISSAIFADYDVTAINVWATWCGPCVNEMPELQELYAVLPENVNFITLCHDGDTQESLALKILESSQAEFQTLIPSPEIEQQIMAHVSAFPTTFFVDSEGNLLSTRLQGAPSSHVVETYLNFVEKALESLPTPEETEEESSDSEELEESSDSEELDETTEENS